MIFIKPLTQLYSGKRKKGFTLTEIAIVLGIMGLILGAIWVAAASVYNGQRIKNAKTAIVQIVQNVRTLYATSGSTGFANVDMTDSLITSKAIPGNLVNGMTGFLIGPFPTGKTQVFSTSNGDGFAVVMSKLSQSDCTALLSAVGGMSRDLGLYQADAVTTDDPKASDAAAIATPLATAITPASAQLATSENAGGCTTEVGPTYKVRFGFTLK